MTSTKRKSFANKTQPGHFLVTSVIFSNRLTVSLAGGAVLIAFLLEMKIGTVTIGLLAALTTFLVWFGQVPGVYIMENLRKRREIALKTGLIAAACWLPILLLPLLPENTRAWVLLICVGLTSLFTAISGTAFDSYRVETVGPHNPPDAVIGAALAVTLAAAAALHVLNADHTPYAFIVLFAAVLAVNGAVLWRVSRAAEKPLAKVKEHITPLRAIAPALKDTVLRRRLSLSAGWLFILGFAAPFLTVYMLRELKLPLYWLIALEAFAWGAFFAVKRLTNAGNLRSTERWTWPAAVAALLLAAVLWLFTNTAGHIAYNLTLLILSHLLIGAGAAALMAGVNQTVSRAAPAKQRSRFQAAAAMVHSLAAAAGPLFGGLIAVLLHGQKIRLEVFWKAPEQHLQFDPIILGQWDLFFGVVLLLTLYPLLRLPALHDLPGPADTPAPAAPAPVAPARSWSTLSPVHRLTEFPLHTLDPPAPKKAVRKAKKTTAAVKKRRTKTTPKKKKP